MFKKRKQLKAGDLVRINSNCENTRKPVYKIYAEIKTLKGTKYILENTYAKGLHYRLFDKEELIKL